MEHAICLFRAVCFLSVSLSNVWSHELSWSLIPLSKILVSSSKVSNFTELIASCSLSCDETQCYILSEQRARRK